MNTLLEIKNHYAQEQGYEDWGLFAYDVENEIEMEDHMNEICIRAQKAALEKAAKAGRRVDFVNECTCGQIKLNFGIDYNTIINPENLIR